MNDVRKIAQARAAKAGTTLGASVESERKRAREAARMEANSYQGQNVRKIAAHVETQNERRKQIVCAYCRVSTDDIGQVISIEYQKNTYRDKIKANPEWQYGGTYVDDGFSGTNTEHRPAFQLMMKRALAGEIDMIITKSVSRFARNLLECMGWIEQLTKHEPPIRVYFEQENLDTLAQTSNIILFVLAMVAEEESHMKSEAMQLSLEWRFSRGRFLTPELFGYEHAEVPDGYGGKRKVLQINDAQANVVSWIYSTLLNGGSPEEMAEVLTELQIPTGGRKRDGTLNTHWTARKIVNLMRNERYCGDVLARKTYTPNFKTHQSRKNNGKKNQYYQPGHHEAIVTRAQWNAAQRILNSRRYHHKGIYQPIRMVDKGSLTGYISMNRRWAGYTAEDYYRTSSIAMGLMDGEMESDLENEHLPNGGRRIGGLMDDQGIQQIARELTKEEKQIKEELEGLSAEEERKQQSDAAVRAYQVVSGEMFSRTLDPVMRLTPESIAFNKTCVDRLNRCRKNEYAELLFNPVERMLVVRPCEKKRENAIRWDSRSKGASALCRILYESMEWSTDHAYRIPASVLKKEEQTVLVFDMDNFIGRSLDKKEAIQLRKESAKALADVREDAKGIFYGPEDETSIAFTDLEERFQALRALEKMIFGTPAFMHQGDIRGFEETQDKGSECWEMLFEARPLDVDHCVDQDTVDDLFQEMIHNPPTMQQNSNRMEDDAEVVSMGEHNLQNRMMLNG